MEKIKIFLKRYFFQIDFLHNSFWIITVSFLLIFNVEFQREYLFNDHLLKNEPEQEFNFCAFLLENVFFSREKWWIIFWCFGEKMFFFL